MSEAVHAQAAAANAQREEQREERAAQTQRETMAAQRDPQNPQREAQQRETQQREPQPGDTQQRETPRDTQQRDTQREAVPQQRPSNRLDDEWQAVQFEFVDDPQAAVRKADDLVTRAIEELASRHRTLSQQWKGEGKHETEDLRLALQRYRELFKSLVAVK